MGNYREPEFGTLCDLLTQVERQPGGVALAARLITRLEELAGEWESVATEYPSDATAFLKSAARMLRDDMRHEVNQGRMVEG